MLAETGADRSQVDNRNINGIGEIVGKITASEGPVVIIYDFLPKSELSNCLI